LNNRKRQPHAAKRIFNSSAFFLLAVLLLYGTALALTPVKGPARPQKQHECPVANDDPSHLHLHSHGCDQSIPEASKGCKVFGQMFGIQAMLLAAAGNCLHRPHLRLASPAERSTGERRDGLSDCCLSIQ
jgi:hypothetical protein